MQDSTQVAVLATLPAQEAAVTDHRDAPDPQPASLVLSGPTSDERTMALIAHALTFVEGGIIGPLIVYLVKKNDSEFIAFHALQSLYFGLLALFVIGPITVLTCGAGAVLVAPYFIFEVIACAEANRGEWYELPIVGGMALRSHHP